MSGQGRRPANEPMWYKDAIIYQTHVKAFFDANNDGIGDFAGLIEKLDYVKDLGVDTIWLMPFYPSPLRDDGYDIQDYRSINPAYGGMADVRRLIRAAHARGLRLIIELVINHTSDQHPWFQRARRARPGSVYRDYYVWSDSDQKYADTRVIFLDTEPSNWTWDPVAKAYYWHRFYSHQPDLNFDSPHVMREVLAVLEYWLEMGVDGLRLDAIPYLIERDGTNCENLPDTHRILKRIRAAMDERFADRLLLAEANQWPEDTRPYFGDGDECHMAFHFPLMPRMYLAMAREDRYPITDIMRQTPEIPESCQWAIFLRNHDELTLEMVTENERDYLWSTYAGDRRMRINLGIRRRLAPLMDNDRRRMEVMNSLLFSMPGTPVVYYGDEIGMGDNVYLGDRDGVRTPMQWSPDRNGGFSRANPQALFLPMIMDAVYGYDAVNVEAQTRSPSSLLNWMKRMIAVRRAHRAFSRGDIAFVYPGNRKILAYTRSHAGETVLCVVNLSRQAQPVELDLRSYRGYVPIELLGRTPFPPIGDLPYLLTLPGNGFYWFLLAAEADSPAWHQDVPEPLPEFVTVVLRDGLAGLISARALREIELDALPRFAANQRWFAAKGVGLAAVRVRDAAQLTVGRDEFLLTELEMTLIDGSLQRYLMPLAVAWGEEQLSVGSPYLPFALAKVRRAALVGAIYDATAGSEFGRAMLQAMREQRRVPVGQGELCFTAGKLLHELEIAPDSEIRRLGVEQSNTSIAFGRQAILKIYRRLQPGPHPEVETSRFLSEVAGFSHAPPLLGALEWRHGSGETVALAAAHGFIENQGDGWTFTTDLLGREVEALVLALKAAPADDLAGLADAAFAVYATLARTLGTRTAELHAAFATPTDDPAFAAEPVTRADLAAWSAEAVELAERALAALAASTGALGEAHAALAGEVLAERETLIQRLRSFGATAIDAVKTRLHGDYHLGQVVVARDDFFILDFEGEPARPVEARRAKLSPLKDVAGMLRSFHYAAASCALRLGRDGAIEGVAIEPLVAAWRERAATSFLAGYHATAGGLPSIPAEREQVERLIEFHLLEKALYEICYEVGNRPGWLHIPLRGVAMLLRDGRPEGSAA